jgi:hypothetical protein
VAHKFHTCSLKGIFPHAHVAVKINLIFLPPAGGKLCEAHLEKQKAAAQGRLLLA